MRVACWVLIQLVRSADSSLVNLLTFQLGKIEVRPAAMLIRVTTGKETRSRCGSPLFKSGAIASCWAIRKLWLRGIALGFPVVPEVKEISAISVS